MKIMFLRKHLPILTFLAIILLESTIGQRMWIYLTMLSLIRVQTFMQNILMEIRIGEGWLYAIPPLLMNWVINQFVI